MYDRFGRISFGSETLVKDVLEYVVFENFLTNLYGRWRMHDKIEPSWLPPKTPILRSYVQQKLFYVDEKLLSENKELQRKFKDDDTHLKEIPDS